MGSSPLLDGATLFLLGLFVAGVYLFRSAVRRVGDRPHCRRCHYDVSEQVASEAATPRCPECGRDLTARRATVRGARGVRWWRRVAGVALLLVTIAVVVAYARTGVGQWYPYMPDALLRYLVLHSNGQDAAGAFKELDRRRFAGDVADADLIDAALDLHGRGLDRRDWPIAYDPFLAAAIDQDRASQTQVDRYVRNILASITLRVRPVVQRDEVLPVDVLVSRPMRSPIWGGLRLRLESADSGTQLCEPWSWSEGTRPLLEIEWPADQHGRARLRFVATARVLIASAEGVRENSQSVEFIRTVEVVPVDQVWPAARSEEPPTLFAVMSTSNLEPDIDCFVHPGTSSYHHAYEVWADFGTGLAPTGKWLRWFKEGWGELPAIPWPAGMQNKADRPASIDILLLPSPARARETVDMFEIWPTAMLFRAVPLNPSPISPVKSEIVELEAAARLLNLPEVEHLFVQP